MHPVCSHASKRASWRASALTQRGKGSMPCSWTHSTGGDAPPALPLRLLPNPADTLDPPPQDQPMEPRIV
eukprot:7557224-Prorocentrum_lima.AAC.1